MIRFTHDDMTRALETDLHELNRFINEHQLEGGTHRGYRRIFNQGDVPSFRWNKGGRLYSQGEDSYQRLKKSERLKMRIDQRPVVEIDVRASFLTILYAKHGQRLDLSRDPYDIPGVPRDVVKKWVTMTLGQRQFHTRWPHEMVKDFRKEHGEELGRRHPVKEVQAAVLAAHPILQDWPEGTVTCFDLMFWESEAIVGTMFRLMREDRIVCLSVHDSIIVTEGNVGVAVSKLREEYRRVTGVRPFLKVHFATGEEIDVASEDPIDAALLHASRAAVDRRTTAA